MDEIRIPDKLRQWISARERFGLSHADVQMGRELGFNPRKLGEKAKKQEPEVTVVELIQKSFVARFKKECPEQAMSIEDRASEIADKRMGKQMERHSQRADPPKSGRRGKRSGPDRDTSRDS
ncbi:MAG: hypothetical protein ACI841_004900 [Planctomycetota bacterium]|jgi:hypothetical protein